MMPEKGSFIEVSYNISGDSGLGFRGHGQLTVG